MIKIIVLIVLYIILIPVFYYLFLLFDWLFEYDHKRCSFYKYINDEEYNHWSEVGTCSIISAIFFPIGLIIQILYYLIKHLSDVVHNKVVSFLQHLEEKKKNK